MWWDLSPLRNNFCRHLLHERQGIETNLLLAQLTQVVLPVQRLSALLNVLSCTRSWEGRFLTSNSLSHIQKVIFISEEGGEVVATTLWLLTWHIFFGQIIEVFISRGVPWHPYKISLIRFWTVSFPRGPTKLICDGKVVSINIDKKKENCTGTWGVQPQFLFWCKNLWPDFHF